jgi:hypothetical protein
VPIGGPASTWSVWPQRLALLLDAHLARPPLSTYLVIKDTDM